MEETIESEETGDLDAFSHIFIADNLVEKDTQKAIAHALIAIAKALDKAFSTKSKN